MVTCIFPNPPDVAQPYDFQSAGWFLGVTDITELAPGKPYIVIASGNRTFRYHCADALEEGISPVSNENQYRQHARECFELAKEMNDPGNKALLVAMAQSWSNLADQAAKNAETDVIYETATRPQKSFD